jgi:hypothetical protein
MEQEKKNLEQQDLISVEEPSANTQPMESSWQYTHLWPKSSVFSGMIRQKYLHVREVFQSAIQHMVISGLMMLFEGDEFMMAMLWAQSIMLGKRTYAQVPRLLKDKVREILIDSGMEELVAE